MAIYVRYLSTDPEPITNDIFDVSISRISILARYRWQTYSVTNTYTSPIFFLRAETGKIDLDLLKSYQEKITTYLNTHDAGYNQFDGSKYLPDFEKLKTSISIREKAAQFVFPEGCVLPEGIIGLFTGSGYAPLDDKETFFKAVFE